MKAKNVSGMYCVARGKSQSHEITERDWFVVWWLVHIHYCWDLHNNKRS